MIVASVGKEQELYLKVNKKNVGIENKSRKFYGTSRNPFMSMGRVLTRWYEKNVLCGKIIALQGM